MFSILWRYDLCDHNIFLEDYVYGLLGEQCEESVKLQQTNPSQEDANMKWQENASA